MSPKIITLTGLKRAGKDSAADYLRTALEAEGYPTRILRFAEPLKKAARNLFGPTFDADEVKERVHHFAPHFVWNAALDALIDLPWEDCMSYRIVARVKHVFPEALATALSPRSFQQILGTEVGRHLQDDIWVQQVVRSARAAPGFTVVPDARFQNEVDIGDFAVVVQNCRVSPGDPHESEALATALYNKYVGHCIVEDTHHLARLEHDGTSYHVVNNHGTFKHLQSEAQEVSTAILKELENDDQRNLPL